MTVSLDRNSVLITGARGALGREFRALMPGAFGPTSAELDVKDDEAVDRFIHRNRIGVVVHCAARTAIRYCEENKAETLETNVSGTLNICRSLSRHAERPRLVYISTACVFAGDDPAAFYTEEDVPHPKNFYALSKLMSEEVIAGWAACSSDNHALVVRTNFAERGQWKHPKAFVDRYGTYLYPDQIAARVIELLSEGAQGVYHVCGNRRLSMYEFARLGDPEVGHTELATYQGPPVTVNMSLASNKIAPLELAK